MLAIRREPCGVVLSKAGEGTSSPTKRPSISISLALAEFILGPLPLPSFTIESQSQPSGLYGFWSTLGQ